MVDITVQVPSIILPTVWSLGTETETVNDALEHTSLEFDTETLQEKQVVVMATEVVALGAPGPLWLWIELSPVLSTTSTAYWAAIGGGGGAIAPITPTIRAGTGTNLTVHTILLPWTMHSPYARLVVQTPVISATAWWVLQGLVMAKTP